MGIGGQSLTRARSLFTTLCALKQFREFCLFARGHCQRQNCWFRSRGREEKTALQKTPEEFFVVVLSAAGSIVS